MLLLQLRLRALRMLLRGTGLLRELRRLQLRVRRLLGLRGLQRLRLQWM